MSLYQTFNYQQSMYPIFFLPITATTVSGGSLFAGTIDGANDQLSFIFQVHKSGTIKEIGFKIGTVTVGGDLRVSLQNIDTTTGFPDNTADEFDDITIGAAGWYTAYPTGDGTSTGTKRRVSQGDVISIVFSFDAYVAQNLAITAINQVTARASNICNYAGFRVAPAAWAVFGGIGELVTPLICIKFEDDSYCYGINSYPILQYNSTVMTSATSPNEIAAKFRLPVPQCIKGIFMSAIKKENVEIRLYDENNNILTSNTIPAKFANSVSYGGMFLYFQETIKVEANTYYRAGIKTTTATAGGNTFNNIQYPSEEIAASCGGDFCLSTRTDNGNWTDEENKQPVISVLYDEIVSTSPYISVTRKATENDPLARGSYIELFLANDNATETQWMFWGNNTDSFIINTPTPNSANVLDSGIDFINIWLPPDTWTVTFRRKISGSFGSWSTPYSFAVTVS